MCLCVQIFFRQLQIKFSQHKNYPHLAKTLIASCAARRSRIKFKFRLSKFVHSADKMAEMRTKFHVIQVKLIMSVWGFTVHWSLATAGYNWLHTTGDWGGGVLMTKTDR